MNPDLTIMRAWFPIREILPGVGTGKRRLEGVKKKIHLFNVCRIQFVSIYARINGVSRFAKGITPKGSHDVSQSRS